MSAPIGPGDWVECVDPSRAPLGGWPVATGAKPEIGRIYRVDAVGMAEAPDGKVHPALTLTSPKGWSCRGNEIGWSVDRFRPIYRPKAELIERLMAPPQCVGEPA